MKTDELIDMLATRAGVVDRARAVRRYGIAVAGGTACAVAMMAATLGPRHDFAQALLLPMFWVKFAFVASLAGLGVVGAWRLATPARDARFVSRAIAGVIAGMWIIAAVALALSTPQARPALFLGGTWTVCPWLIAGLSMPVFVALAWAVKGMAPTRLRRAGAMAGFASGALAAMVYAFHCPELGAPFVATWYVVGMLVPTAVGALLGARLLRW